MKMLKMLKKVKMLKMVSMSKRADFSVFFPPLMYLQGKKREFFVFLS